MNFKLNEKYNSFINPVYQDTMPAAFDVFCLVKNTQKCENVIIEMGDPYSTVMFDKIDTVLAVYATMLKWILGYNDPDMYNFYLNNVKFEYATLVKSKFNNFPYTTLIENFLEKHSVLIQEKNIITVKAVDSSNNNYPYHLIVYLTHDRMDFTNLYKELDRYKLS